jgi:hypothetical protein
VASSGATEAKIPVEERPEGGIASAENLGEADLFGNVRGAIHAKAFPECGSTIGTA